MIDRLISEKEASHITGLSIAWFQRKRWSGGGPPFVKFDRAVRYKESDLLAWIEDHAGHRSTADIGDQPVVSSATSSVRRSPK